MPKVSIVMPIYNSTRFLMATLNSILNQTYKDWSLILIDDGSTDNSAELAEAFISVCPQYSIRLIRQENMGAPTARNRGIEEADGEYIAFIDSDDIWLPEKLEKQVHHLDVFKGVDCSFVWSNFIDGRDNPLPGRQHHKKDPSFEYDGLSLNQPINFKDIVLANPIGNGSTPLIRRDVLDRVKGFDTELKGSEDSELWYRLYVKGCTFQGIREVLCLYRIVSSSSSSDTMAKLDSWECSMSKLAMYAPNYHAQFYSLAKAYQLRYLARRAVSKYEGRKALRLMMQAIKENKKILFNMKSIVTMGASLLFSIRK